MKTKRYILTGGPGVGKTETVEKLREYGYFIIGDVTKYIKTLGKSENGKFNWTPGLQMKALELHRVWEKEIPKGREAFIAAGIPDGLAYYEVNNKNPPCELLEAAKKANYEKVFMIGAPNDKDSIKAMNKILYGIYTGLGYKPIMVPRLDLDERINFILEKVEYLTKGE